MDQANINIELHMTGSHSKVNPAATIYASRRNQDTLKLKKEKA